IMVGGQKIQVGLAHARKTVQVTIGPDTYQVAVETGITVTAARTASRDIRRHKASNYPTPRPDLGRRPSSDGHGASTARSSHCCWAFGTDPRKHRTWQKN